MSNRNNKGRRRQYSRSIIQNRRLSISFASERAIDELTTAVHEPMIAARDTTREISEAARELKERGVIKDTGYCHRRKTAVAAREIGETAKRTAQQVSESAPVTDDALRDAATKIKSTRKKLENQISKSK